MLEQSVLNEITRLIIVSIGNLTFTQVIQFAIKLQYEVVMVLEKPFAGFAQIIMEVSLTKSLIFVPKSECRRCKGLNLLIVGDMIP